MSYDELSVRGLSSLSRCQLTFHVLSVSRMRENRVFGTSKSFLEEPAFEADTWHSQLPPTPTSGTYKVKYHADDAQDFVLDVDRTPVDLTLIMPHYRALNQPIDHKMSMFVVNRFGSTKLKVVSLRTHLPQDNRLQNSNDVSVPKYIAVTISTRSCL